MVPLQTELAEAAMVILAVRLDDTVSSITLDAAAPLQSVMQSALARRLNQVVCKRGQGVQVMELDAGISEKPVPGPTTDCCHLYASEPVCPDGRVRLVIVPGVNPAQPV